MTDWTRYGSYVSAMPLAKRAQVRLTSAQIAEEIFLYTQRNLIIDGHVVLPDGRVLYQAPPAEDFSIIKHLPPNGATA